MLVDTDVILAVSISSCIFICTVVNLSFSFSRYGGCQCRPCTRKRCKRDCERDCGRCGRQRSETDEDLVSVSSTSGSSKVLEENTIVHPAYHVRPSLHPI